MSLLGFKDPEKLSVPQLRPRALQCGCLTVRSRRCVAHLHAAVQTTQRQVSNTAHHFALSIVDSAVRRYCTIVFDSEANDFEAIHASQTSPDEAANPDDPLSGTGLFISPLTFDGEVSRSRCCIFIANSIPGQTLRKIVTAFGGVEHCRPFDPNAEGANSLSSASYRF